MYIPKLSFIFYWTIIFCLPPQPYFFPNQPPGVPEYIAWKQIWVLSKINYNYFHLIFFYVCWDYFQFYVYWSYVIWESTLRIRSHEFALMNFQYRTSTKTYSGSFVGYLTRIFWFWWFIFDKLRAQSKHCVHSIQFELHVSAANFTDIRQELHEPSKFCLVL